jgi:hypothetical protein
LSKKAWAPSAPQTRAGPPNAGAFGAGKSMKNSKSVGLDRLSGRDYKFYWHRRVPQPRLPTIGPSCAPKKKICPPQDSILQPLVRTELPNHTAIQGTSRRRPKLRFFGIKSIILTPKSIAKTLSYILDRMRASFAFVLYDFNFKIRKNVIFDTFDQS